jgi:hypothetical protein
VGKQLAALFAGVVAIVLIVAGCGSSSGSSAGTGDEITTSSISKAQFIKKADAACEKGEKQIQVGIGALGAKKARERESEGEENPEPTEADYAELIDLVVAPNIENEIDEIRALGAPSGDEDQIKAFVDAREESIEIAERAPKLILRNSGKMYEQSDKLANEYGLKDCGNR